MGQQSRNIDQHALMSRNPPAPTYQSKQNYLCSGVKIKKCPYCKRAPNVILQDAEYTAARGHKVHQGKFSRVQIYCNFKDSHACPYTVYTPLEGPTYEDVTAFWDMHGYDYGKTTVKLNSKRPDGR